MAIGGGHARDARRQTCVPRPVTPLSVSHPELALQLVDVSDADRLSAGSARPAHWACPAGHEWQARVSNRAYLGQGCPYCAGQRAIVGVDDLASSHPELAAQLVDTSLAHTLKARSNRKAAWRCAEGHVWEATPDKRTSRGQGCPVCAGQRVVPGANDLATLRPDIAAELADPREALSVTVRSGRRLDWVCSAGHRWSATVASRTGPLSPGCPCCARSGYDPTRPGVLYCVSGGDVYKVGISGAHAITMRLHDHARQGLTTVVLLRTFLDGHDARKRERQWCEYVRGLPAELRVSRTELPDGFTEAVRWHRQLDAMLARLTA